MRHYICNRLLLMAVMVALAGGVGYASQPEDEYRFAQTLMVDRQEYDLAAQKFISFLKQYPQHSLAAQAYSSLGYCYTKLNRHGAAAEAYVRLVAGYPQADAARRREAMLYAGDAFYKNKTYERAVQMYGQLLAEYPRSDMAADALYWRAESYLRMAEAGEAAKAALAVKDFEQLVRSFPKAKNVPSALFSVGMACYEQKSYPRAIAYWARLVEEFAKDERAQEAQFYLAECYYQQRQYGVAEKEYARLLSLFPDGRFSADAQSGIAWCAYSLGNAAAAAEGFMKASSLAGKNQERRMRALYDAAAAYREAGNLPAARRALESVVATPGHSLHASAQFRLGSMLLALGKQSTDDARRQEDLTKAVQLLKDALKGGQLADLAPEAATSLGEAYLDLKDFRAAAHVFDTVVTQWPKSSYAPWALYHRALALQEGKDVRKAIAALQALIQTYPENRMRLQATYALAEFARGERDLTLCREGHQWVAQHGAEWARNYRDEQGHVDADLIARAQALAADSLYRLAESWYGSNAPEKAKSYFEQIVARYGDLELGGMARLRLGEMAEAAGQYADARGYYLAVLDGKAPAVAQSSASFRAGVVQLLRGQKEADSGRRKGYLEEARVSLDRFLAQYPKNTLAPQARYYRAEALYALGNPKAAQDDYAACLKAGASCGVQDAALLGLAWCQRDLGNTGGAIDTCRTLVRECPTSKYLPDAQYLLACELHRKQDYSAALAALDQLAAQVLSVQMKANALLERGRVLSAMGNHREAVDTFSSFLKENPRHSETPRVLYALSWAWWNLAKPKLDTAAKARDAYEKALDGQSLEELSGAEKARVQALKDTWVAARTGAQKDEDNMAKVLRHLADGYPAFVWIDAVWLRLGEVAYDREKYEDALRCYQQALRASAGRADSDVPDKAQYRIGWSYLRMAEAAERKAVESKAASKADMLAVQARQHRDAARAAFELLGSTYAKSELAGDGYFQAAEIRRGMKDFRGALVGYRHARTLSPAATFARAALYGAGVCLLEQKQWGEALKTFREFLQLFPDGAFVTDAQYGVGQASLMLGAHADAGKFFRLALQGQRAGELAAKARYGLGMVALAQQKWSEAREEFLKVDAFYGQYAEWASLALLRASEAAVKMGEHARARKDLERILAQYGQSAAVDEARGVLAQMKQN